MRRMDRALKTPEEILRVLDECETIRLALQSDTYPYVVPLSFGWEEKDERVYLYVHGAREGLRHDLRVRDNRVCVEADRFLGYARTSSSVTCQYESVIGFGRAEIVDGEEARHGLELILQHCGYGDVPVDGKTLEITGVWRITLSQLTGKRRRV